MTSATVAIAQAIEAWAVSVIPGLHSYDHAPRSLLKALPLVLAEVASKQHRELTVADTNFQQYKFQQTTVDTWAVNLLLLVDPSDAWNASQTLYTMTDSLGDAIDKDPTLGGRVKFASKDHQVSFDPPEFEYADGTIARAATLSIVVGQQKGA
jgi:hypothetical protein